MDMQTGPARILIVDDHREMAENIVDILSEAFEGTELHCELTRDREESIALARESEFDLALVDLHLPDGHGLDLLRELRQLSPFVQVVVITGDSTVESAISALQEGAFGYVLKPFRAQQLVETATNAIEHARLLREREALREQLEASERRNREVIDRAPALILALDESSRIVVWNQQLETVTGFTCEEVLGADGASVIDHEDIVRLEQKGGGHRSVRWKTAVVAQPEGRPPLRYAVGQDVTEEREMQLRAMRAERLAAVGTLAAGLAHEVRNPLNSATLQLQLLERKMARGKLDEASLRSTVEIVKSEIERLDGLVTDFLAFAKPNPFTQEQIELNGVVRSVIDLVGVEATNANVTLVAELDASVGHLPIDPQAIRQVILNLVRNAVEAVASGGQVQLRTRPAKGNASVYLDVVDDGPGFAEDAPVFDAFYTTKDGGTGLGLAIVHRIVSEHGGSITVTSRPGHTRFRVELPQPALSRPPPAPL
jgi:signal transduction histidine kinase